MPDNIQIPKIIHQIWIGDEKMPDHCVQFVKEMKDMHPDWQYKLWGNEIFTDVYKEDEFLQSYIKNPKMYKWAFIADRIRLLLLRDYGGIYCDVDAKPIQSFNVIRDKLSPNHTFVAGLKQHQSVDALIDCTVYGSAPNSRIINECLSIYKSILWACGCKMFSDKIIKSIESDVALFGYEYFYNTSVNNKTIVLHDIESTRLLSWVNSK